jgi:hypothetical protein
VFVVYGAFLPGFLEKVFWWCGLWHCEESGGSKI